jgi:CRISPR-associated protein Csm1
MENIRKKIVLAALLHDIGKFWQRGDEHFKESKNIQNEFKGHYKSIVPTYQSGHPKYVHSLWTYVFFNQFKRHNNLNFDEQKYFVQNLASKHHQPSNIIEGFISLADKWSSGIDRPDEGEEDISGYNDIKKKWGNDFVRKIPMFNIFDSLKVGIQKNKNIVKHKFCLKELEVLGNETPIFSTGIIEEDFQKSRKKDYEILWRNFVSKYEQLPTANFKVFYHSLINLLKEFTWCIPSATNILPANVSLFEHLKSTAGFAICLYDHYCANQEKWDKDSRWNPTLIEGLDPVLMLCVDISGIQSFIYDISSSKAAKSLKGRSFYIQLLMQSIINEILFDPDINLYYSNVIYSSGGKCYILLPNTDKVKVALKRIEKAIESKFWSKYKGKIFAAFGTAPFRYKSFLDDKTRLWTSQLKSSDETIPSSDFNLGTLWKVVSERANEKKRSKFKNTILSSFDDFFPEQGIKYAEGTARCSVTGERHLKSTLKNIAKEGSDELLVSPEVNEQIKLGTALKSAEFLASFFNVGEKINGISPGDLSSKIEPYTKEKKLPFVNKPSSRIFINEFPKSFNSSSQYAQETIFYGGNLMPETEGRTEERKPKNFHELAEFVDQDGKKSSTKLGFLRMDVDGLGQIFKDGIDEDKKSFAAYATLSMMLDLFFSGYINSIRNQEKFKDWIQILYSGGDDLFVIGRWDKVIEFAEMIREEFRRFVGRDDISISGGVAIVGAKYPITKAAKLAAEAEEKSKHFDDGVNKKDAFTFFGEAVKWGEEFEKVKYLRDKFLLFDGQYGRGTLEQIQTYYLMKKEAEKTKDLSYKWHSVYYFSRLIERIKKNNTESREFFKEVRKNILHNNSNIGADRYLDLVALAARWAQYILKMNLKT